MLLFRLYNKENKTSLKLHSSLMLSSLEFSNHNSIKRKPRIQNQNPIKYPTFFDNNQRERKRKKRSKEYIPDMEGAEAICNGAEQSHWVKRSIKQPKETNPTKPKSSKTKRMSRKYQSEPKSRQVYEESLFLSWEPEGFSDIDWASKNHSSSAKRIGFRPTKAIDWIEKKNLAER